MVWLAIPVMAAKKMAEISSGKIPAQVMARVMAVSPSSIAAGSRRCWSDGNRRVPLGVNREGEVSEFEAAAGLDAGDGAGSSKLVLPVLGKGFDDLGCIDVG
jgi:hypothetical protein